jgi:signal transduction histidine kinase
MQRNSLALRLFMAAAAWLLLIVPATAFALISLYRDAVETSFDVRLNYYLQYLIAASAPDENLGFVLEAPSTLGEPLFALPASGWYWQIQPARAGAEPVQKSPSLVSEILAMPEDGDGAYGPDPDITRTYVIGPEGQLLRMVTRNIVYIEDPDNRVFIFAVAGDAAEIDESVLSFTTMLIIAFIVLSSGLLMATLFQVRYGLRPLADLREGLSAIRSGDAERLEGIMPTEIRPLQDELNRLIQSNQDIIERSRTHVGNLAHALKTPLSVITNEARGRPDEFAQKISEQSEIMRQQISHHLDRARMAARAGVVGRTTPLEPVVASMAAALEKIYDHRELDLRSECPKDLRFQGEKQDLQEMVGNLMDNACKWANARVHVAARKIGTAADGNGEFLEIVVDDDGPGLSAEMRSVVVKRGRRLDEDKPGSGLGLSIVADLSALYKGQFLIEDGPLGGVRAKLILPGVEIPEDRRKNARI